ncbi:MAG: RNA chaperone ProQ [Shewanellaceae bacterium]|nr:RNA chaperone ProQ [Shewanellaceae bacterium]
MMDSTPKITDLNHVLAYLAEKFPLCFTIKGLVKPLKIGIFQDIAAALGEDERVSKTQLRLALRRYTNSWRYLKSVQVDAERIDLNGQPCAIIEPEHALFAAERLKESQAHYAEKRKQMQATKQQQDPSKPAGKKNNKAEKPSLKQKKQQKQTAVSTQTLLTEADVTISQRVKVKIGTKPVSGHILDLCKDEVSVQLDSGLIIKARYEHLSL